mmetsp:Transcript_33050/g.79886  ORF Transcript_33050/g.79886 Transcript_33050/m.79886 type:complete len:407 (-) Transcript_33050:32-1252(-)|eukprot:CAMPEP_0113625036 /NCGR_PEP_ID=MMETSP0017_2-20120614/12922_1 /TAXON_ID=2856 /ORGANISM="Cylindrotheca closterium" /LENGTH=406 /DNA_ID=CAMNT_0000535117 /DNA_START=84 /DNA_END=1307 /DNA_ORIENTATION=+ /assembly_acc=CAM_ASM_000147
MPPPPSQQGKFKPKKPKPKKKIKAGAATANAAAAEPKATVSFAPSPYAGRGGRGRGRGGRGRGRMQVKMGTVYFTGGETKKGPSSASGSRSTRSSSGTRSATASKQGGGVAVAASERAKKGTASTEEVVGQLEVAIGSSKEGHGQSSGKGSILDSMDFEDQEGELFRPAGAAQGNVSLEGFMYDTDSSEEEESRRKNRANGFIMSPLELPLKDAYTQSSESEEPKTRQAGNYPEPVTSDPITMTGGATRPSPFAHLAEGESSQRDDWFLVQLPTRLPPLQKKVDEKVAAMDVDEDQEREQVKPKEEATSAYSEVVTHPVAPGGFDNALLSSAPGRIGKMVVYKSGKTVLVMEGPDGSTLQLNVAEGLSCSFLQQAVAIDSEKNTYTELGEVVKSLVVSPVLDHTYH